MKLTNLIFTLTLSLLVCIPSFANNKNSLFNSKKTSTHCYESTMCNVAATSSAGTITVTGLTSEANSKLFDENIESVWECNPWNDSPCSGSELISGLPSGTYFLSVQSDDCNEWIPITLENDGSTCDLQGTISNCTYNTSVSIFGLFSYDIFVTAPNASSTTFTMPVTFFPNGTSIVELAYGETHTLSLIHI